VNNTHVKQFTEKKTQRFICIQQYAELLSLSAELLSEQNSCH